MIKDYMYVDPSNHYTNSEVLDCSQHPVEVVCDTTMSMPVGGWPHVVGQVFGSDGQGLDGSQNYYGYDTSTSHGVGSMSVDRDEVPGSKKLFR
jgi:hypothetical protein